jgi:hypothetical protein
LSSLRGQPPLDLRTRSAAHLCRQRSDQFF